MNPNLLRLIRESRSLARLLGHRLTPITPVNLPEDEVQPSLLLGATCKRCEQSIIIYPKDQENEGIESDQTALNEDDYVVTGQVLVNECNREIEAQAQRTIEQESDDDGEEVAASSS